MRISAFEDADLSSQPQVRPGKCDAMLFPSGIVIGTDALCCSGLCLMVVTGLHSLCIAVWW